MPLLPSGLKKDSLSETFSDGDMQDLPTMENGFSGMPTILKATSSEITYEDKTIIGNGLPKSWMGFTNTFTYGNLDLTVFLRGAFGFHLLNTRRIFFENRVMVPTNIFKEGLNSPVIDDPQYSDYYVERGDYVKLDNLTLGYTIPVRGQTFQMLRVYASGQNLLPYRIQGTGS
jgi:TonB-dependent starch-binding outer membrane protein SusC